MFKALHIENNKDEIQNKCCMTKIKIGFQISYCFSNKLGFVHS